MQVILPRLDQSFYVKQNVIHKIENEQAESVQINNKETEHKLNMVQNLQDASKSDYVKRERHHKNSQDNQASHEGASFSANEIEEEENALINEASINYREGKNYNSKGEIKKFGGKNFDFKI